jgi:hypothetical protein
VSTRAKFWSALALLFTVLYLWNELLERVSK